MINVTTYGPKLWESNHKEQIVFYKSFTFFMNLIHFVPLQDEIENMVRESEKHAAEDKEKREKGAANLVVLSRERSGVEMLQKEGVIAQIARLMKGKDITQYLY